MCNTHWPLKTEEHLDWLLKPDSFNADCSAKSANASALLWCGSATTLTLPGWLVLADAAYAFSTLQV